MEDACRSMVGFGKNLPRKRSSATSKRTSSGWRDIESEQDSLRPDLSEGQLAYETGQVLFDYLVDREETPGDIKLVVTSTSFGTGSR